MLTYCGRNFIKVRQGINLTAGWGGFEVVVRVGPFQWYIARHRFPKNPTGRHWFWDRRVHRYAQGEA